MFWAQFSVPDWVGLIDPKKVSNCPLIFACLFAHNTQWAKSEKSSIELGTWSKNCPLFFRSSLAQKSRFFSVQ
jgi:hypothetical protein